MGTEVFARIEDDERIGLWFDQAQAARYRGDEHFREDCKQAAREMARSTGKRVELIHSVPTCVFTAAPG